MPKLNQIVSQCVGRWRQDLRELSIGLTKDPFCTSRGRSWERDFLGEIGQNDVQYAVFIVIISLVPAAAVAYITPQNQIEMLAGLFRSPLQVAISGFLTSVLVFAGSHFNKVPRPFSVSFKLMLRIMAIHPILAFFLLVRLGEPLSLLAYGFFVVRGVRRTFGIPLRNALLFFGVIYIMFAFLQLQTIVAPPAPPSFDFHHE